MEGPIGKEGKACSVKYLQWSPTVELILLDGSVDHLEMFVRREREFIALSLAK